MSGILSVILVLGVLGGGVYLLINRCQFLNLCDQPASADPAASSTSSNDTVKASFKSDKGQRCGCCKCHRVDGKTVHCITSNGDSFDFQNGLSLDAQCKACGSSASICPDEVANANENAAKNVTQTTKSKDPSVNFNYKCAPGFHPNVNGVCVSDNIKSGSKKENKPKSGVLTAGCKANEIPNCYSAGPGNPLGPPGTPICTCGSHYARSMYGYIPQQRTYYTDASRPRNPFKSHISYI